MAFPRCFPPKLPERGQTHTGVFKHPFSCFLRVRLCFGNLLRAVPFPFGLGSRNRFIFPLLAKSFFATSTRVFFPRYVIVCS